MSDGQTHQNYRMFIFIKAPDLKNRCRCKHDVNTFSTQCYMPLIKQTSLLTLVIYYRLWKDS